MSRTEITALMARGEEVGCVNLSEFDELVRALELPDDEVETLQEELDRLGVDLTDDCGRANVQPTQYRNDDVAGTTTDALQLFLNEVRRYELLTAPEEVELA